MNFGSGFFSFDAIVCIIATFQKIGLGVGKATLEPLQGVRIQRVSLAKEKKKSVDSCSPVALSSAA